MADLIKEKLLDRFDKNSVQEAGKKTNAIHGNDKARHIKLSTIGC